MVGKSTGGNAEIGRNHHPSAPMMITPTINSVGAMGRGMKGSEMFMDPPPGYGPCPWALRAASFQFAVALVPARWTSAGLGAAAAMLARFALPGRADHNLRARLQLGLAVDH